MTQRKYIKNRTNRRVAINHFEGNNKRKGRGRRKHERYSHYAYISIVTGVFAILIGIMVLLSYNMEL